ncbi:hypothetical protein LXL04_037051 [Taraxacum kok-saghyz]
MKPQHISSDTSVIHDCKRMVGERFRQAFQATTIVVDDNKRSGISDTERRVLNAKEVKRKNRRVNTEDPIRTIMFLGSWSHTLLTYIGLREQVPEAELIAKVHELDANPEVHGEQTHLKIIIEKDVDGFHPLNIGKLVMKGRQTLFRPCIPREMTILAHHLPFNTFHFSFSGIGYTYSGGIGSMAVAMLLKNTLYGAKPMIGQ